MNLAGQVLNVNEAFTQNYGYNNNDIYSLHLSHLFNSVDRTSHKPELELATVQRLGNSTDENYLVHKNGREIWTTGESMLVFNKDGEKFIIRDVINLESTKQLERFLLETEELLEKLFELSQDVGILILDSLMKIIKAFLRLFEMENPPVSGSPLSDMPGTFWSSDIVCSEIRNSSTAGATLEDAERCDRKE